MSSEPHPPASTDGLPLVVAFADARYLPLLQPWVARLRQLGVIRLRVYGLDDATCQWCLQAGVEQQRLLWDGSLQSLWQLRIEVFARLVDKGEDFVHSDIDAIWLRNALLEGAAATRQEDLVFSQGTVWPPDVHAVWGFVLCCGWFRVRASSATRDYFASLAVAVQATGDDQVSVNRLLVGRSVRWHFGAAPEYALAFREHRFRVWHQAIQGVTVDGRLSICLLPHREFQRLPEPYDGAVVKHLLTPKNCQEKLVVLRAARLLEA